MNKRMNKSHWLAIAILVALLAAFWLLVEKPATSAVSAAGTPPPQCGKAKEPNRSNRYVSAPALAGGTVSHPLTDWFGHSYASGSYVAGYWVKTVGKNPATNMRYDWQWRSGSGTRIESGQRVKACIAQAWSWSGYGSGTWYVVSPAAYRS